MESQKKVIESLIEEGKMYTFRTFCLPNPNFPDQYGGADTPEWNTFKIRTRNIVTQLLSDSSPAARLVAEALGTITENNGPDKFEIAKANLIKALTILSESLSDDIYGELKDEKSKSKSTVLSNKVFIVHGHDQSLKIDVERFIHEIGLIPIVLHREADEGNTIIEKFEKHSDVGYAFILLTPDELSYTVGQATIPDTERTIEFRARPNVIFEFGYFIGKLGRSRVCCLHKGNVSVPSDLNGLVYKKVEGAIESQGYSIIKELIAAGYRINM